PVCTSPRLSAMEEVLTLAYLKPTLRLVSWLGPVQPVPDMDNYLSDCLRPSRLKKDLIGAVVHQTFHEEGRNFTMLIRDDHGVFNALHDPHGLLVELVGTVVLRPSVRKLLSRVVD